MDLPSRLDARPTVGQPVPVGIRQTAAATVWADQILVPSDLATSIDAGVRYVYVTDRRGGGLIATGGP